MAPKPPIRGGGRRGNSGRGGSGGRGGTGIVGKGAAKHRSTVHRGTHPRGSKKRHKTDNKLTMPKPTKNADGSYTIRLHRQSGWSRRDFRKKAKALQKLGQQNKLVKQPNPVPRSKTRTGKYRKKLQDSIDRLPLSQAQKSRIQQRLHNADIDHRHDLQLGGADNQRNMWAIDSTTNQEMGGQIWNQINDLSVGDIVRVDVTKW